MMQSNPIARASATTERIAIALESSRSGRFGAFGAFGVDGCGAGAAAAPTPARVWSSLAACSATVDTTVLKPHTPNTTPNTTRTKTPYTHTTTRPSEGPPRT